MDQRTQRRESRVQVAGSSDTTSTRCALEQKDGFQNSGSCCDVLCHALPCLALFCPSLLCPTLSYSTIFRPALTTSAFLCPTRVYHVPCPDNTKISSSASCRLSRWHSVCVCVYLCAFVWLCMCAMMSEGERLV